MNAELFHKSLLAKGWSQYPENPNAFYKLSAGFGGDISYVLDEDGLISQLQDHMDKDGNLIKKILVRKASINDFEDELSAKGLWQLKPGKSWVKGTNTILF